MSVTVPTHFTIVTTIVTVTLKMYAGGMHEQWHPDLEPYTGHLHDRLIAALRADIEAGLLLPEDQLPTHRALAARLGIGIGTVSRAYAEAERLGLVTSAVGRGTFVGQGGLTTDSDWSHGDDGPIDLTLNLQANPLAAERIADTLARLPLRPDFAENLGAAPVPGIDWHRQTLAGWLRTSARYQTVDWRRLLVTTGAQQAMAIVIATVCQPGDVILTEAVTFNGFRALADQFGCRCVGVAMDDEGMTPDGLDAAIRATGSRLVYVLPTLQNPTTRTMSNGRRDDIARVARAHDLTIIEDDVYAPIAHASGDRQHDLTPIAEIAPERTCYVGSASKAMAMGLRVGVLVAPDDARFEAFGRTMRADCYAASSISSLLACQLIKDGSAAEIQRSTAAEASARMQLAQRMLGDAIAAPSFSCSLHAWLPMPELRAERIANGALRRGVMLTPPASFVIDGGLESGLRLCLNAVTRPQLERALRAVRSALADEIVPGRLAIV